MGSTTSSTKGSFHANVNLKNGQIVVVSYSLLRSPAILTARRIGAKLICPYGGIQVGK